MKHKPWSGKQMYRLEGTLRKNGSFAGYIGRKYLRAKLLHGGTYISWQWGRKGRAGGGGGLLSDGAMGTIERQYQEL